MKSPQLLTALLLLAAFLPLLVAPPAYAQAEAEVLLSVSDPVGDALGVSRAAALPTRPAITEEMLDITGFSAHSVLGAPHGPPTLQLRTEFARLGNPWDAPLGFSAQTLDIFVKTASGGNTVLPSLNLQTKEGGWNYHIRVTGYGATLAAAEQAGAATDAQAQAQAPRVRVEGQSVVVDTELPAGEYLYWVTSSVFSPLSPDGLLRPNVGGGPFSVSTASGEVDAPVPLDLLVPETSKADARSATERSAQMLTLGRIEAVGELASPQPWWLAALGAGGLVLALVCSAVLWQWRD